MDNSIFGSFQSGISSFIEKDRQRIEEKLEEFKGPCLLDCIEVELTEVDVFSAKKVRSEDGGNSIVRQPGQVLKEKGAAKIYIERNLYEDFCRDGKHLLLMSKINIVLLHFKPLVGWFFLAFPSSS